MGSYSLNMLMALVVGSGLKLEGCMGAAMTDLNKVRNPKGDSNSLMWLYYVRNMIHEKNVRS